MAVTHFSWPKHYPRHPDYRVFIDGEEACVFDSGCGAFVIVEGVDACEVRVEAIQRVNALSAVDIKPHRHGLKAALEDRTIRFAMQGPADVLLEIGGGEDLFLFYGAPLEDLPDPADPKVHYFKAGQVYEVGDLEISEDEQVYVEGGAVLCGSVHIVKGKGARVRGRGLIDASYYDVQRNSFLSEHSEDILLEGLTFVRSAVWTVKPSASRHVLVDGIRILAYGAARDGIDINGCQHAVVRNCFVRSEDDCVAIKSAHYGHPNDRPRPDFCQNVEDILIEGCSLYSFGGGSAMEMGHEFRCDTVKGVVWRNIDVLAVHQFGSAFSIRHCDGAHLSDILYEDIRIEHHYHNFLVFQIIESRYSWEEHKERGRVSNVTLRRIKADHTPYNAGYTVSLIGGWDAEHGFSGIHFEDFIYGETKAENLDDLWCYHKHLTDVTFS